METKIEVFWRDEHVSDMYVDYTKQTIHVENYTEEDYKLPFLVGNLTPSWEEYQLLIDSRVFPRERQNCKEILSCYGLDEYDQEAICRKSHAVMYSDYMWFRYPGERVTFDDVRVRD